MATASKPVVDFDHFSSRFAGGWREIVSKLSAENPIAWTESHGGYWVLSDHDALRKVAMDWETFSSLNDPNGGENAPRGLMIPPFDTPITLNESDPPESTRKRMIEAPFFTPRAIERQVPFVKQKVDEAIDLILEKGAGEFVYDLVMKVPAQTVLNVLGVSADEWLDYAVPAHIGSQVAPDSPDYPAAQFADIMGRLIRLIQARRADPREDMATSMANAKLDGEPLDDVVGAGLMFTLATGGFDTATSLLCNALIWLEQNRDAWPQILASDKALDNAINELLRAFPPNLGTARNVMKDVEICGQTLRKGERILLAWSGGNYDERKFACPHQVQLDRKNAADHLAFGWGGHRCLGAPLARLEARTILAGVMRRMPNYRILTDKVERFSQVGLVNGFNAMPFVLE
jgi:cytochrome P450